MKVKVVLDDFVFFVKESEAYELILNDKINLGNVMEQTERMILKLAEVKPSQMVYVRNMNQELATKILNKNFKCLSYLNIDNLIIFKSKLKMNV